MKQTCLSHYLAASILLIAVAAGAQEVDGPPLDFQRAYKLAQARQYDEALKILDGILEQGSNTRNALFSAGSIALMAGQFERSRGYLFRLRELEPRSGRVRAALVRANQGMGDLQARDRERLELFRLRSSGEDPN